MRDKILSSEYATYREKIQKYFREKVLESPSLLLDPMAGTAPLIPHVETNGYTAYFNDILPIHFFINKAKTYEVFEQYRHQGYDWFRQELLQCMSPLENRMLCMSEKWINDDILNYLIQAWHLTKEYDENSEILLKATILLCVRPFSSITKSNNSTWLKFGGVSSNRSLREIVQSGLATFDRYYHKNYGRCIIKRRGQSVITRVNAEKFELPDGAKADIILTSPPYCNRLDPIVLYGPENYFLSFLGYGVQEKDLISTTKVKGYNKLQEDLEYLMSNSKHAHCILTKIGKSEVKDDTSYYLKYYTRYFAMLSAVMNKILSNLASTGKMYIVTQDNIHRGILIEIDKVLAELLARNGWRSRVIKKWEVPHQGLRNVSRKHAFVKPKHWEKLIRVTQ